MREFRPSTWAILVVMLALIVVPAFFIDVRKLKQDAATPMEAMPVYDPRRDMPVPATPTQAPPTESAEGIPPERPDPEAQESEAGGEAQDE
jgi:hypothetical protein